jgi:hypothetical protein
MKVALPARGSVSFLRAACLDEDDGDDSRSIATETGRVPREIPKLRGTVPDEGPTEVMGYPWWLAELPPGKLAAVGRVDVIPRRDARMSLAPLTLLLVAPSLAQPALTVRGSTAAVRTMRRHRARGRPAAHERSRRGDVSGRHRHAAATLGATARSNPRHPTRHRVRRHRLVREVPF